jgi:aminoglycoside/choline kinase family phosphotransferase
MPLLVIDDLAVRDRVQAFLDRSGLTARRVRVVPLTGDASDRTYFRVIVPNAASIVLAVHAAPFDYATLPFVEVADLLRQIPIPVPAILGHEDDLGILAVEDLGDVTLQAHLGAAPHADHHALYRQAVGLIAVLQRHATGLKSERYLPYRVAFDVEKLTWEMDFFLKHFVEGYRGAAIDGIRRSALREELARIVEELAAEPRVLCHRDYHSRNLMLRHGRLYVIDFQDARMGPDTYDLVSLLRDSYVDLPEPVVGDLIAYFLALQGHEGQERPFRRRFDLMALQRNLKALGTFGYQTTVRKNPVYIQYIPRTLRYVRTNLERYPRFGRLRELLAVDVEELGDSGEVRV